MGKSRGKHPEKALTAMAVRAMKAPGRYADGNGLYLVVDPSGAKRWLLRLMIQGKRRDIGLGGCSYISLAEAREKALDFRKVARTGGDPLANKEEQKVRIPTFAEAAEQAHKEHAPSWRNYKHAAQWITTLKHYVFPTFGSLPVDQIGTPEVVRALSPIWLEKPETARRVRQRMGTVFDWAQAHGFRTGENPIRGASRGLPKQNDRDKHHEAMPYGHVPEFIKGLRADGSESEMTRLALEFLILTAARTGEVIGARWSEIDDFESSWIIPPERMKASRLHRVPLVIRCNEILLRAKELGSASEFVFPGRWVTRPMSNMALSMLLRRMKVKATVHGFRSSFRDWASECTNVPREVCEMALAHTIDSKVEAAYRRGDLFEKRRELMRIWAEFITSKSEGIGQ